MQRPSFTVVASQNPEIFMQVTPGHFATSSSHITHYLDMSALKTNAGMARQVARELAVPYLSHDMIDTLVCMEGTEVIGAYLADEMLQAGTMVMNSGSDMHILTPMNSVNGQLIFQKNELIHIHGKHVVLLVASVSSRRTIARASECLQYYGGNLVGISALFAADPKACVYYDIHTIFTQEDIPGYHFARPSDCAQCQAGEPLDAIVNSGGYTVL